MRGALKLLRDLRLALFVEVILVVLCASVVSFAQEPGNVPKTKAPAPTQVAPPTPQPAPRQHPDNDYWRKHDQQLLTDFPWLARFKEDDLKLGPPGPSENRVVFMGDSITEGWHLNQSFPGKPYINRGISGQTTPQMVLRFRQDVIA